MYQKSVLSFTILLLLFMVSYQPAIADTAQWWDFQAIDTMKYSRDMSGQFLHEPAELAKVSEEQVKNIADLGATHVAIATPYDEEFLPVLVVWVAAARRHGLHVWFRGNWSGWEEWFGYESITRDEHLAKTVAFIEANPDLFENGDYFSPCPECENGGPGDPRYNDDVEGHKQFLIDEQKGMVKAFRQINKNVQVNLNSMNGDVAKLVMDKETTKALGGYVVIDHYVSTPKKLNADIDEIAKKSGGKVILGEYGAPIPDIHGDMSEQEQADWIDESLSLLMHNPNLKGISYWTNMGGSTALWTESGKPKKSVEIIKKYFSPKGVSGKVTNQLDVPLQGTVHSDLKSIETDSDGSYSLPYLDEQELITFSAPGYISRTVRAYELENLGNIKLAPEQQSWWYQLRLWFVKLLR